MTTSIQRSFLSLVLEADPDWRKGTFKHLAYEFADGRDSQKKYERAVPGEQYPWTTGIEGI